MIPYLLLLAGIALSIFLIVKSIPVKAILVPLSQLPPGRSSTPWEPWQGAPQSDTLREQMADDLIRNGAAYQLCGDTVLISIQTSEGVWSQYSCRIVSSRKVHLSEDSTHA